MSGPGKHWEQDKEATVYVGNLDERITDEIVWELMLQAGRIVNVHLPKDRVTQNHQGYGFVEFVSEEDADYAAKIMNAVRLWGKPIRVNKASADKQKTLEVGAELFVGNLDPMVDEKVLFETFARFGNLTGAPKISRDENNLNKGFGFVSFTTFEAADEAIENMNGQYLMNKEITVQYAYKKDGKGDRHGDAAERSLAASGRAHNVEAPVQPLPPQLFTAPAATAPPAMGNGPPGGYGGYGGFGGPYGGGPPQQSPRTPMQAPPGSAGLPPRPPPPAGGYGGAPPGMPGYGMAPPGGPMGFPPPMQNGYAPYSASPGMPPGMPPVMPPGMAPPGFQRR